MRKRTAIEVFGLSKSYGKTEALRNLNLKIEEGEFFGFLGPNGAGKTTTIRLLSGQMRQDAGDASVLGIDTRKAMEVKRAIGIVPETVFLPSFLSVEEYLEFVCRIRNVDGDRIEKWLGFTQLSKDRETLCKDLSLGMKQKLSFASAFLHDPRLVFLDEPFADVDPLMQNKMRKFLGDYVNNEGTIFLSTHILEIAEKLCSRIGIIDRGNLVKTGVIGELLGHGETLEEIFLSVVESDE